MRQGLDGLFAPATGEAEQFGDLARSTRYAPSPSPRPADGGLDLPMAATTWGLILGLTGNAEALAEWLYPDAGLE